VAAASVVDFFSFANCPRIGVRRVVPERLAVGYGGNGRGAQSVCGARGERYRPKSVRFETKWPRARVVLLDRAGGSFFDPGMVNRRGLMPIFAEDPELLRRFRSGDRDALARVYGHYVARVEALIRRGLALTGAGPRGAHADLADLVQEVFMRAFSESARKGYDGARPYGPLLMTLTRNTLVDFLRRRRREEPIDAATIERLSDREIGEDGLDVPWAEPLTMALVERYVAGLPEPEHAIYVQRYALGRSQLQAADALGLTRQQVRTLEEHVRAGLARELARARLATHADGVRPVEPHSSAVLTPTRGDGE
jgi:RNA polymerase sigma factor (sigma-70 family)